jgi:hypothetical protein
MSAAWHGVVAGAEAFAGQGNLLQAIGRAMDFWFANDFTNPSCLDSGGTPACPCGTPGFWNTNWFSSVSRFFCLYRPDRYMWSSVGHRDPRSCGTNVSPTRICAFSFTSHGLYSLQQSLIQLLFPPCKWAGAWFDRIQRTRRRFYRRRLSTAHRKYNPFGGCLQ